ncbi:excisionase family DNA binding protein [Microbacterium sp. AK009]|uniref:helix-turn-helix transcriptional regulator n=1 Tax=Microbacterium sp. AK009 TaxID=2723068 RepID=UPI0017BAC783|nr:helix-turn-helix domain-containing protein [Microbacterium sp. AK009]NYF17529.1 excisionase family DNA binding protein [Microbacterium sp. AK009]
MTTPTTAPEMPEVMTRAEVAEFTRISLATLARWAGERRGPRFVKAGGRVLYRKHDVLAWLDSLSEAS